MNPPSQNQSETAPRIALFLRTLGGGGAERAHINLARGFTDLGCQVDLVLSAGEGLELWEIPDGVRVIDLAAPRVSASLPSLIQYLQQERPAAIIPTLHYAIEVAIVAKLLARVPTKVLVPEQNNLSTEVECHEKRFHRRLIPWFVRLLYPLADAVIGVSHGVAADLSKLSGMPLSSIGVIYNPAITADLQDKAHEPVDHPWFYAKDCPVILGVGRLEDQKDFPNLIRAFAKVRQVRNAKLAILGWGPDRPQLEALIQELGIAEDVWMPGFVKNPYAYMAKASVFTLSSRWEGMPNVLIEAMAVSTPVVSTDCPSGPSEALGKGKYGHLIPVGDDEALATAILSVLSGQAKPVDEDWLEQFTLPSVSMKYLQALGVTVPVPPKMVHSS